MNEPEGQGIRAGTAFSFLCFVLRRNTGSGGCGNVGIAPAISKGSWVSRETCFWFSSIPTSPSFPQPSSRRFPLCEASKELVFGCFHLLCRPRIAERSGGPFQLLKRQFRFQVTSQPGQLT